VIAPFAGVVHVGLALLEHLAVTGERVEALRTGDADVGGLVGALAVDPLDLEAFLLEQALVVGDELRQPLEWRRGFQNERFHGRAPRSGNSYAQISTRVAAGRPALHRAGG